MTPPTDPGTTPGARPSDRPNRDMAAGPRAAWWRRALWAVLRVVIPSDVDKRLGGG